MKKVFFAIILVFAFSGCTYTTVSDLEMQTIDVHVRASDWIYSDNPAGNNYFYAVVNMPEITASVFDKGEVQAYRVYDKYTDNAFKHILPDVLHVKEVSNGNTFFYTTTVDCVYGVGWLEFNYRASDFAYEDNVNIAPAAMDFSIVVSAGY